MYSFAMVDDGSEREWRAQSGALTVRQVAEHLNVNERTVDRAAEGIGDQRPGKGGAMRTMPPEATRRVTNDADEAKAHGASPSRIVTIGRATLVNDDCLSWMRERAPNSIHAVVTDPPYGLREFNEVEKAKRRAGRGGVWRIPPELDGCKRMPVPRFTTLTAKEQQGMREFFAEWARLVLR
ncbi:MAG: hypothetical protein ABI193_08780, partial [Minicystis sp.]